jgi:hypothetical protein
MQSLMVMKALPLFFTLSLLAIFLFTPGDAISAGGQSDNTHNLPPWSVQPLKASQVPRVYLSEWKKAENRHTCAPLALLNAEKERGIKVRRANFYGGWAVAYDTPAVRSSFGIAGAGIEAGDLDNVFKFPHAIRWSDGSIVSYGPEGNTGPDQLAYLKVSGQSCLYNIWTKRGRAHLEQLISTLRLVQTPSSARSE